MNSIADKVREVLEECSSDIVLLKKVSNVMSYIDQLEVEKNALKKSMDTLDNLQKKLIEMQTRAAILMEEIMPAQSNNFTRVDRTRRSTISRPIRTNNMVKIKITEANGISGVKLVNTWGEVRSDGLLHYVAPNAQFAFKIGDLMLYGNIGEIYSSCTSMRRITSCKYEQDCKNPSCQYYHDPMIVSHSREYRNYIDISWLYSHGSNPANFRRPIGSRSRIDADLFNIKNSDINRFYSQVMHDILLAALIHTKISS